MVWRAAVPYVILLGLAAGLGACSKKQPAIDNVTGSEPRRLSFGAPPEVQATFLEKIRACWFGNGELKGYRYETMAVDPGPSRDPLVPVIPYQNIKIYDEKTQREAFEVQFHPYNENTLISTRNFALPAELANKLKRDLETWILRSADCS